MGIRMLAVLTLLVLASLTEGVSLNHVEADSKCTENVYKTCAVIVAHNSLRDILKNFCSFYVRWRDCVAKEASACKSRDLMLTGWVNDRCMEQKI